MSLHLPEQLVETITAEACYREEIALALDYEPSPESLHAQRARAKFIHASSVTLFKEVVNDVQQCGGRFFGVQSAEGQYTISVEPTISHHWRGRTSIQFGWLLSPNGKLVSPANVAGLNITHGQAALLHRYKSHDTADEIVAFNDLSPLVKLNEIATFAAVPLGQALRHYMTESK